MKSPKLFNHRRRPTSQRQPTCHRKIPLKCIIIYYLSKRKKVTFWYTLAVCGWSPNVGDFTPLHRQKNSSKGCKSNRSPIYLESESVFVTCCILLLATTHRLRVARGDRSCFCSSWFRIIKIFAEWAPDSRDQPECPLCMTRSFGLGVWEGYGQRHSTLECFSLYTFPI